MVVVRPAAGKTTVAGLSLGGSNSEPQPKNWLRSGRVSVAGSLTTLRPARAQPALPARNYFRPAARLQFLHDEGPTCGSTSPRMAGEPLLACRPLAPEPSCGIRDPSGENGRGGRSRRRGRASSNPSSARSRSAALSHPPGLPAPHDGSPSLTIPALYPCRSLALASAGRSGGSSRHLRCAKRISHERSQILLAIARRRGAGGHAVRSLRPAWRARC